MIWPDPRRIRQMHISARSTSRTGPQPSALNRRSLGAPGCGPQRWILMFILCRHLQAVCECEQQCMAKRCCNVLNSANPVV